MTNKSMPGAFSLMSSPWLPVVGFWYQQFPFYTHYVVKRHLVLTRNGHVTTYLPVDWYCCGLTSLWTWLKCWPFMKISLKRLSQQQQHSLILWPYVWLFFKGQKDPCAAAGTFSFTGQWWPHRQSSKRCSCAIPLTVTSIEGRPSYNLSSMVWCSALSFFPTHHSMDTKIWKVLVGGIIFCLSCFHRIFFSSKDQQENPSPELNANFPSRILFSWLNNFVIAGWKHLPDESDVHSLKYSNTASCINQAWQKTTSSVNNRCKTTQRSNNATARQLIRVFGIQFLQSSVIRLLNVVTKMVSVAWCTMLK